MSYFFAVVFAFGIMIFFHELGHYAAARLVGIRVLEFAMGMGPKLLSFTRKGTLYTLRALPIGGFVRMHGMDPNDNNEIAGPEDPQSYQNKTIGQRALVIAAGSLMNFVLATLLFIVVFSWIGVQKPLDPHQPGTNIVGMVIPTRPAQEAGVKPGDRILSINGKPISTWDQVIKTLQENGDNQVTLAILRDGRTQDIPITPFFDPEEKRYIIGVLGPYETVSVGPGQAVFMGLERTYTFTHDLLIAITQMFTGKVKADIGGPVQITQQIAQASDAGMDSLLGLIAFLSINLGVINLLPLPALDGGHLALLGLEKLRGRPLDPKKLVYIQMVGMVMLLSLLVFVTYRDLARIFGGS